MRSFGLNSLDLIEENLYLGGAATAKNVNVLNRYKISHILTIDNCPLPQNLAKRKHIIMKYIPLSDHPKEDLLSNLEEADCFIRKGISKGVVLVHCFFGISRSASLVIAHIMKKYNLTYSEAFERVKTRRDIINPNEGFVQQLKLYEEMGYQLDYSNMHYKFHLLTVAAEGIRKGQKPQNLLELVQPDPGLELTDPKSAVYRCRNCHRILALRTHIIQHKDKYKNCTRKLFLQPITWMNVVNLTGGKFCCPKCSCLLGSFSWIKGSQCQCGIVVCPAFYMLPSKVTLSA